MMESGRDRRLRLVLRDGMHIELLSMSRGIETFDHQQHISHQCVIEGIPASSREFVIGIWSTSIFPERILQFF